MKKAEFVIDRRSAGQLCERIKELSASYTPEWNFNISDPDIGSTIAMIYANQMSGNIRRLNQTIGKYHTEFVNLLGLSLKPAYPASGVVVAQPVRSAVAGVPLPHGTRLVAEPQSGDITRPVIFETTGDIYVTGSRLQDIISISGRFGKIIPLMGDLKETAILEAPINSDETAIVPDEQGEPSALSLFDYSEDGIEQHALLLYHKNVFDALPESEISIRINIKSGITQTALCDPELFEWSYFDGESLAAFKAFPKHDGCIGLIRSSDSHEVTLGKENTHIICLKAKKPVFNAAQLYDIKVSSCCENVAPDNVSANGLDVDCMGFMPFGDEASLFSECYIGCENIFHQRGSRISMEFHLDLCEKIVSLTARQQEDELKIIKRKSRESAVQTAFTSPQSVMMEYFNGIGWRRIICDEDWSALFDGTHTGDVNITFTCPEDWEPVSIGGFTSRSIRLRIVRADNCYLRPCKHTMPVISGLKFSYTYEDNPKSPQHLIRISGTKKENITQKLFSKEGFTAFSPLEYIGNSLYLGFDSPIEGAPMSILFDIEENVHFESAPISFEYSSLSGFKPLRVIDNTNNMSNSGTVVFMPPADFFPAEVEGISRRWLRLTDERGVFDDPTRYHAVIRAIMPNAVEIRNIEQCEEESFYIASASPNMTFALAAENILSADVFVNEKDTLPLSEAERMAAQSPDDVRIEYNFLGGIQSLFVRWKEVESFDLSKPGDRHYIIDRMNNRIIFGDGINVRIPSAQNAAAFTVKCLCCRGEDANLPKESVSQLFENIMYLDSISNPIATYAGSSIEKLESAQMRGANMISSRGRLVSVSDYEREVLAFSDTIEQVRCVAGTDAAGKQNPSVITLAILTCDYKNGGYSFRSIKDRLLSHLLSRCEITADSSSLILTEPFFVEITLNIWAVSQEAQRSFDVQNAILSQTEDFLDPLGSHGWNIGELPDETQIGMMLHSIRGISRIKRYVITARYTDSLGSHDTTLDRVPANPFVIPINGSHRVYMELPENQ